MKVLMFTWEFPPFISGGLGMACYGMVKSLLNLGIKVDLVLPTKDPVYFPLSEVDDVDKMPAVFLEPKKQKEYLALKFTSNQERLNYIGITVHPESYIQMNDISRYFKLVKTTSSTLEMTVLQEEELLQDAILSLIGEEDLIKKVQEYTVRAQKIASALDYDLIHAHDWLCYPAGMLAKKISRKPLIVHIHATEFDRAGGPGDERIHRIEYAGMSYADRVIAVSQYTAQMIMSRYRIDSGRIKIVHNAFTVEVKEDAPKQRIFKGPTILFLGRVTLQKGPDYFLEVAEKVIAKHPEARFIVAGTGDMSRKILRKSASLRLKNKFLFTGFLNRKQVDRALRAADIFVMPSVSEPFGIAPLEAMAYGVTTIISKQSGVAEVVNNAFKIDFWDTDRMADTICYLIEHPDVCKKMGEESKKEVNHILWDEAAEKIRKVYTSVLTEYLSSPSKNQGISNA
ncbi:MAG TPA: glycosyltransferase [Candidatus Cloacimonadota bacterium]|nr:glycosyltransferase [Candidatus Cloacimonadota bacterium]HQL15500.1 glycosyltransferase [Candidatus Cloacimonadota bacterium]